MIDMEDIPPRAGLHQISVKSNVINRIYISAGQTASVGTFHGRPDPARDAHQASPGHTPWHSLDQCMPKSSCAEIKQSRGIAASNVISCSVLVPFTVCQQWPRILFNGCCSQFNLCIDT